MSRTRNNNDSTVGTVTDSISEGPAWQSAVNSSLRYDSTSPNTLTLYEYEETLVDEEHGHGRENPCSHKRRVVRRSCNPARCSSWLTVNGEKQHVMDAEIYFPKHGYGNLPPDYSPTYCSHTSNADPSKWTVPNYSYDAVRAMWPEVEANLSVINSIYELKDFKRLPNLLRSTNASIESISKLLTGMGSFKRKTLKQLVATAAGQHLNYMFAVRPLLSDIAALRAAFHGVAQRVDTLLANKDKTFVSHYRRTIDLAEFGFKSYETYDLSPVNGTYADGCRYRKVLLGPAMYHAVMRYNYSYSRWQIEHARLLGYLDALGLNLNPSIIWNAVRFSFILDWVVKINRFLDSAKIGWLRPSVNIDWFTHSLKYKVSQERLAFPWESYFLQNGGSNDQYTLSRVAGGLLDQTTTSYYVRRQVWPNMYQAVQLSGLSTTEITLGTSLIGSAWSGAR